MSPNCEFELSPSQLPLMLIMIYSKWSHHKDLSFFFGTQPRDHQYLGTVLLASDPYSENNDSNHGNLALISALGTGDA